MSYYNNLVKMLSVQSFDRLLTSLGVTNIDSYDRIISGFLNPVGGYITIGNRSDESGDSLIDLVLGAKDPYGNFEFGRNDIRIFCFSDYAGMNPASSKFIRNIGGSGLVSWNERTSPKKCSSTLLYGLLNSSIDLTNTREVAAFLNCMPNHVASNMVPYLDVEFESLERFSTTNSSTKIKSGMYKFMFYEDTNDPRLGEFDKKTIDIKGLAKIVDSGEGGLDNVKYSYTGMDMFTTPQPFFNQGKGTEAYLSDVINPFSPIASLNGLNITITPSGPGGGTYNFKTAKFEFLIHDRSRMDQFSDILDPANSNNVIVWLTYGWRYKNYKKYQENDDPYSDFINGKMMWKEGWKIITVSYSFEGQGVRVSMDLSTQNFDNLLDTELSSFGKFSTVKSLSLGQGKTVGGVLKDLEENLNIIKRVVDLKQGSEAAAKVFGGVAGDALELKFPGELEDNDSRSEKDDDTSVKERIESFIADLRKWTEGVVDSRNIPAKIDKVKADLDDIYSVQGDSFVVREKFSAELRTKLGKMFKALSEREDDPFLHSEYRKKQFRLGLSKICITQEQVNFDEALGKAAEGDYKPLSADEVKILWDLTRFNDPPTVGNVSVNLAAACARYDLDLDWMKALISHESTSNLFDNPTFSLDPISIHKVSPRGALGLGQIMPIAVKDYLQRGADYLYLDGSGVVRSATGPGETSLYLIKDGLIGDPPPNPENSLDIDIRYNWLANIWMAPALMRWNIAQFNRIMVMHSLATVKDYEGINVNPSEIWSTLSEEEKTILYVRGYNGGSTGVIKNFLSAKNYKDWILNGGNKENREYYGYVSSKLTGSLKKKKLDLAGVRIAVSKTSDATTATVTRPNDVKVDANPDRVADLWATNIPSYVCVPKPHGDGYVPSGSDDAAREADKKKKEDDRNTIWRSYTSEEISEVVTMTIEDLESIIQNTRMLWRTYPGILRVYTDLKKRSEETFNALNEGEKARVGATITRVESGNVKVEELIVQETPAFQLLVVGSRESDPSQQRLNETTVTQKMLQYIVSYFDLKKYVEDDGNSKLIESYESLIKSQEKRNAALAYQRGLLAEMRIGEPIPVTLDKAFDYKYRMVSYGTIFNYFVLPSLAELNQVDEVQLVFGELNKGATCYNPEGNGYLRYSTGDDSSAMNLNIAEFPIDIEQLYKEIVDYCIQTSTNVVTVGKFISLLNSQLNDPTKGKPYYLLEKDDEELKPEKDSTPSAPATPPTPTGVAEDEGDTEDEDSEERTKSASQIATFKPPAVSIEMKIFPLKARADVADDALDRLEYSSYVERSEQKFGRNVLRVRIFDSVNKANPKDLIKGSITNRRSVSERDPKKTLEKLIGYGIPIEGRNIEGYDESKRKPGESTVMYSGGDIEGLSLREKQMIVENSFSSILSTIMIGAEGTCISSVNLATNTDKLDASSRMTQKTDPKKPFGSEVIPYLPERVYPAKVSMTTLGCPLFEYSQMYFINFGTHTDIDNQYGVNGITHSFSPGKFTTNIEFIPVDLYGAFRSKLDPRSLLESLEYTFGSTPR